jgi:hypothetical protein
MVAKSSQFLLAEIVDVHRPEEVHPIQARDSMLGVITDVLLDL